MTDAEIQCLKENIDKLVEIQTVDGEHLIAKILSVFHSDEWDEHEVFYEVVSSNMIDSYHHVGSPGGYALDFDKIVSVKSAQNRKEQGPSGP